jgi:hypothetical protein
MKPRNLRTAGDVIDALGGTAATARLTGRKDQHVSNWRAAGKLPAKTFLSLSGELETRGLNASPSLWGIKEPERAA